jgi:hypothetical protein
MDLPRSSRDSGFDDGTHLPVHPYPLNLLKMKSPNHAAENWQMILCQRNSSEFCLGIFSQSDGSDEIFLR